MGVDELLQMPDAEAVALLAHEANWPQDIIGAVRAEWHRMTAEERLAWLRRVEETRSTMDRDAFGQWQARGADRRRGDSIPAYYRGYWKARRRL